MKSAKPLGLFVLLIIASRLYASSSPRQWTDVHGRTFKGTFISANPHAVKVQKGRTVFEFPLQVLSKNDKAYVFEQLGFQRKIMKPASTDGLSVSADYFWKISGDKISLHILDWQFQFNWQDPTHRIPMQFS